jgi:hypothetical protein
MSDNWQQVYNEVFPPLISDFKMDQPVATTAPCWYIKPVAVEEEKEHTMSCFDDDCECNNSFAAAAVTNITVSDEAKQRAYIMDRIGGLRWEKQSDLEEQFYMNSPRPKTLQQMADWLKAGNYTVNGLDKEPAKEVHYWQDYFSWRTKPADRVGFQIAGKALDAAVQTARDAAALLSITEATAAMNTLAAWTYTAPTA